MSKLLKAKPLLNQLYENLKQETVLLNKTPRLQIILIGENAAAKWYVSSLQKKGLRYGLEIILTKLMDSVVQTELLELIREFNEDPQTDGIMLQKPLPEHLDENLINSSINPEKDVDGFHPVNLGRLVLDQPALLPCTPQAVMAILKFYQLETAGKNAVILGRSNIVGKPLGLMLLQKNDPGNATVTICHSYTENLAGITRQADILIAAIGKAGFVKPDMVKPDAVVIDVGTNLIHDPQKGDIYVGDVDFEAVLPKVKAISPVPGGVGSVTTAFLLTNLIQAAKINDKK
jgi:methylenetetrahydrofolate dehydrogenase (NADP+)/methenyltetrahydrofolate cyclohydrolase